MALFIYSNVIIFVPDYTLHNLFMNTVKIRTETFTVYIIT